MIPSSSCAAHSYILLVHIRSSPDITATLLSPYPYSTPQDHIDRAFSESRCHQLKYCEPLELTGKGYGVTVTPFGAGKMVGSCVWKVSKDGNDVVYAVDFNHAKERHLAASPITDSKLFNRPAVLITVRYP